MSTNWTGDVDPQNYILFAIKKCNFRTRATYITQKRILKKSLEQNVLQQSAKAKKDQKRL